MGRCSALILINTNNMNLLTWHNMATRPSPLRIALELPTIIEGRNKPYHVNDTGVEASRVVHDTGNDKHLVSMTQGLTSISCAWHRDWQISRVVHVIWNAKVSCTDHDEHRDILSCNVILRATAYNWEILTLGMDMKAKTEQLALKQFLLQDCACLGLGRSNRPCQYDPWASQLHA